jgi:hypothetical protein
LRKGRKWSQVLEVKNEVMKEGKETELLGSSAFEANPPLCTPTGVKHVRGAMTLGITTLSIITKKKQHSA